MDVTGSDNGSWKIPLLAALGDVESFLGFFKARAESDAAAIEVGAEGSAATASNACQVLIAAIAHRLGPAVAGDLRITSRIYDLLAVNSKVTPQTVPLDCLAKVVFHASAVTATWFCSPLPQDQVVNHEHVPSPSMIDPRTGPAAASLLLDLIDMLTVQVAEDTTLIQMEAQMSRILATDLRAWAAKEPPPSGARLPNLARSDIIPPGLSWSTAAAAAVAVLAGGRRRRCEKIPPTIPYMGTIVVLTLEVRRLISRPTQPVLAITLVNLATAANGVDRVRSLEAAAEAGRHLLDMEAQRRSLPGESSPGSEALAAGDLPALSSSVAVGAASPSKAVLTVLSKPVVLAYLSSVGIPISTAAMVLEKVSNQSSRSPPAQSPPTSVPSLTDAATHEEEAVIRGLSDSLLAMAKLSTHPVLMVVPAAGIAEAPAESPSDAAAGKTASSKDDVFGARRLLAAYAGVTVLRHTRYKPRGCSLSIVLQVLNALIQLL